MIIPGVLLLNKNKRYGFSNKKRDKYWYKVKLSKKYLSLYKEDVKTKKIGDKWIDILSMLPSVYVSYKLDLTTFTKHIMNKYILVEILLDKKDKDKENENENENEIISLYGTIYKMIGDIKNPENIYEYLLYERSNYDPTIYTKMKKIVTKKLNILSKTTLIDLNALDNHDTIKKYHIRDLRSENSNISEKCDKYGCIFSIDPEQCTDFDDACSIQYNENKTKTICIYIANITIWFDLLNIWDLLNTSETTINGCSLSTPISSIYLPNKTIHMLPPVLSEHLCSLKEKTDRYAFTLKIHIDDNHKIIHHEFFNSKIRVSKNFIYESKELLKYKPYKMLKETCRELNKNNNNFGFEIRDSHEVIQWLMIYINKYAGEFCKDNKIGIFRCTERKEEHLHENNHKILWCDYPCIYKLWSNHTTLCHLQMKLKYYIHISSPIRRIIDIINMSEIQSKINIPFQYSSCQYTFINEWKRENTIESLNRKNKHIKKIHNETKLISLYMNNPERLLGQPHEGLCIDITFLVLNWNYSIYFPNLNIIKSFHYPSSNRISLYSKLKYKFFIFKEEDTIEQKLKIELVEHE